MQTITVIVEADEEEENRTLGALRSGNEKKGLIKKDLDLERLRQSMAGLSESASTLFKDVKQVGGFRLKEVKLQVEINAQGGFALIGVAKAGAKGAITLTFKEE